MKQNGRTARVIVDASLREREEVFRDRGHAGAILTRLVKPHLQGDELILAIPAGGVPVATVMARQLEMELDLAVVSKITIPGNSEAGYGAVAFDGTSMLNESLLPSLGLSEGQIREGIETTRSKVRQRLGELRRGLPDLDVRHRRLVVVDDGLASGATMQAAVEALQRAGASEITVAIPTSHVYAVSDMVERVHRVVCANVRSCCPFAVASAYERWEDVTEAQVQQLFSRARQAVRGSR